MFRFFTIVVVFSYQVVLVCNLYNVDILRTECDKYHDWVKGWHHLLNKQPNKCINNIASDINILEKLTKIMLIPTTYHHTECGSLKKKEKYLFYFFLFSGQSLLYLSYFFFISGDHEHSNL